MVQLVLVVGKVHGTSRETEDIRLHHCFPAAIRQCILVLRGITTTRPLEVCWYLPHNRPKSLLHTFLPLPHIKKFPPWHQRCSRNEPRRSALFVSTPVGRTRGGFYDRTLSLGVRVVTGRAQLLQLMTRIIKRNQPQSREEVHERAWGAAHDSTVGVWTTRWVDAVPLALAMKVGRKDCIFHTVV
jgi:hypothetical protein